MERRETETATETATDPLPASIAIAGAWGYIGRKFLDVALAHGLPTYVYDPGPAPADVDPRRLTRIVDEAAFYGLEADVFHLAVHPEHRRVERLLERPDPQCILNEKPMAEPGRSAQCRQLVEAAAASPSVLLYDFPELFDPLTARIVDFLAGRKDVRLTSFYVQRSKDREDPANPRNFKRMVPIQYQETVHCLAFVLHILAAVKGSVRAALADGVQVRGESDPYTPPNPEVYPHVVDGRCRFQGGFGDVAVEGYTDFKRGACWAKRRIIRGVGDGASFEIEVSFLEGSKALRINGREQPCDPAASSYEHVLRTLGSWVRRFDRTTLMQGRFPNPEFAQVTYQLSSALWASCRDHTELAFEDLDRLNAWEACDLTAS